MVKASSAPGSKSSLNDPENAEPGGNSFQGGSVTPTVTAVMVDAGFFLKRARAIFETCSTSGQRRGE